MEKVILQVPISKKLKQKAEEVASDQGFSSLQESVRVFLTQLTAGNLVLTFQPSIKLSRQAEKRYLKISDDFSLGKNVIGAENLDNLLKQLNENPLS